MAKKSSGNGTATACHNCGEPMSGGPWFKRFCGDRCRSVYHATRLKRATALLEATEGPEARPTLPIEASDVD